MAEVVLKKKKTEVLVVNIEDKKYSIPLGGSLPYSKLKELKTDDAMLAFFKEYIPEDVFDGLTVSDIGQIVTAWGNATKESQGLTPGE